jgi:hypothetical protein
LDALKASSGDRPTRHGTVIPAVQRVFSVRSEEEFERLTGLLLSSESEILQLAKFALPDQIDACESALELGFFLAFIGKGWRPRVVSVFRSSELIGVVCTKERVIRGIPTGVVFADGALGSTVLAAPSDREEVFRIALRTLVASPQIHGVRLRTARGSSELSGVREFFRSTPLDVEYYRIKYDTPSRCWWQWHPYLPLAETYEDFLKTLGSTTRRNFRYYRRRFEQSGHSFVEAIPMNVLRSAAYEIAIKSKYQPPQMESDLEILASTRRPIAVGLRHRNGDWLAIVGGTYISRGAVLLFQYNNDQDFGADSLSIVLRSYLIEFLIRKGRKELVILNGTAPPLSRYVKYRPMIEVHLDKRTASWRASRFCFSTLGRWLPGRLGKATLSLS